MKTARLGLWRRTIALLLAMLLATGALGVLALAEENGAPTEEAPADFADYAAAEDGTEEDVVLPAAYSLVGSSELSPITNQGGIGSCVSEAIAYKQFTNAVAHFLHAADPLTPWNPSSGNADQIFAAQWVYNYCGGWEANVYDVLKDNGGRLLSAGDFFRDSDGAAQYHKDGVLYTQSTRWNLDNMERTFDFRLKDYEVIYINSGNGPYTTSVNGISGLRRVKEALITDNVVAITGYSGYWMNGHLTGDGVIGKAGEAAIIAGGKISGTQQGNHCVSVVGYDDEITCKVGNSTMKGGFLIANSWGTGYGTNGYTWIMYDALNSISEFEEYNQKDFYKTDASLDSVDGKSVLVDPVYSATGDLTVTFTKSGKGIRLNGKKYDTYNLTSEALDGYLAYNVSDLKDNTCHIEREPGNNTTWALIPYETITSWGATESQNIDESYNGSYWLFAAGRSSLTATGYCYLDAGLGNSPGREVNIASHNRGQYPEAKSWVIDGYEEGAESFTSLVTIKNSVGQVYTRVSPMGEFYLTHWDTDITLERPELYLKMDVTTDNRNGMIVKLARQELTETEGRAKDAESAITAHLGSSPFEDDPSTDKVEGWTTSGNKIDFDGNARKDAKTLTKTLYFSYNDLVGDNLDVGKKITDYRWGIKVGATKSTSVTYSNAQLLNQKGDVLATLSFGGEDSVTMDASGEAKMSTRKESEYYFFDDSAVPTDTYTPTFENPYGEGVTVTPLTEGEVGYGQVYSFRVDVGGQYNGDLLTVKKNGRPLLGKDGVYTTTLCDNATIAISGITEMKKVGDVDGSGDTEISDVTLLLGYLVSEEPVPAGVNTDLSGDGAFTTKDVTRVLAYLSDPAIPLHLARPAD